MSPTKLIVAGTAIVLLFAVALGFSQRRDSTSIGDPTHSSLGIVTRIFPQRSLAPSDLSGVACYQRGSHQFVVAPGSQCRFSVAAKVKRVLITWASPGPRFTATLTRPGSITQTYHSDDPAQDAKHPDEVSMPIFGSSSTMTLDCPGGLVPCRATLR